MIRLCLLSLLILVGCKSNELAENQARTAGRARAAVEIAFVSLNVPLAPDEADPRPGTCENCHGTGRSGDGLSSCQVCGGDGRIEQGSQRSEPAPADSLPTLRSEGQPVETPLVEKLLPTEAASVDWPAGFQPLRWDANRGVHVTANGLWMAAPGSSDWQAAGHWENQTACSRFGGCQTVRVWIENPFNPPSED